MRALWGIHISRTMLALLACVSAVATVVIIHAGLARTPAQTAALTALHQRRELLAQAAPAPARAAPPITPPAPLESGSGGATGGSGGGAGSSAGVGSSAGGGSTGGSISDPAADPASTTTASASTTTTPAPDAGLPHVGHVFVITLSTPSYAANFGKGTAATYLHSLVPRGTLLSGFESLGHGELADELAMISGQAPNTDTTTGCSTYREFPSNASANNAGVVSGSGCVYPDSALTIGDQVTSDGKVWGAYIAAMGTTACQHPNSNTAADVPLAGTEPGYDLQHNPFVFFHSVLDDGDCASDDQDLTKLPAALDRAGRTPRFVYVGADACGDGDPVPTPQSSTSASSTTTSSTTTSSTTTSSTTAASSTTTSTSSTSTAAATTTTTAATTTPPAVGCPAGEPSGIAAEDAFLATWVPAITGSPAYRKDGVLVVAFAGTGSSGHPVRTGALVLSRWTQKHRRIATSYGPYSLLRSVEDMLNDTPLAHATHVPSFAKAVL